MHNERTVGIIISYISLLLGMAISLVYTPYMMRVLGQAEYGLFSVVNSTVMYLTILDFGFSNSIVRYTAKYRVAGDKESESRLYGMFLLFYLAMGAVALFGGTAITLNVGKIFAKSLAPAMFGRAQLLMAIAVINVVISFPMNLFVYVLSGYERYIFIETIELIAKILNPLIMLGVLFAGFGAVGLLAVTAVLTLLFNIIRMIYCFGKLKMRISFRGLDKAVFKEILNYSFFIFLVIIADKLYWNASPLILGIVRPSMNDAAIYNFAYQYISLFITISSIIGSMHLPQFTRMVAQKTPDNEISNEFIRVSRLQFFVCAFILGGFFLIGKPFLILLSGPEYAQSYTVALLIMSALLFCVTQNVGTTVLQAKNLHRFRAYVQSVMSVINVVLVYFFAKRFGAVGAAAATALTYLVCTMLIMSIYYQKRGKIRISDLWKQLLPLFPSDIAIIALCWILRRYVFSLLPVVWDILCTATIFALLYIHITYRYNMNNAERLQIRTLVKNIKSARRKEMSK